MHKQDIEIHAFMIWYDDHSQTRNLLNYPVNQELCGLFNPFPLGKCSKIAPPLRPEDVVCSREAWPSRPRHGVFFFCFHPSHRWAKNGWSVHHLQFAVFLEVFLVVISQYQGYTRLYRYTFWIRLARWGHCRLPQWEQQGHASAAENVLGVMTNHCLIFRKVYETAGQKKNCIFT